MRILLDSWAWLEVLNGTKTGAKIIGEVKKSPDVFTTSANLYEVCYRVEEDEGKTRAKQARTFIENRSKVLSIDESVALAAVGIRLNEGLRAIDAFTLAAARLQQAKVFTGDKHFKNLKDVVFFD